MQVETLTSSLRRSLEQRLCYLSEERIPELEATAIHSEDEDRHTPCWASLALLGESARR